MLAQGAKRLGDLQERLYAEHRWALLVILQGLDTAGKDGVIEHVMAEVNPKAARCIPSRRRANSSSTTTSVAREPGAPQARHIGIFNRSYYEEVLVVRVHPKLLENQSLPPSLITKNIWQERYEDINAFERILRGAAPSR